MGLDTTLGFGANVNYTFNRLQPLGGLYAIYIDQVDIFIVPG